MTTIEDQIAVALNIEDALKNSYVLLVEQYTVGNVDHEFYEMLKRQIEHARKSNWRCYGELCQRRGEMG